MKTKFRPRVPHLSRRTIALGAVAFIALQAFAPVAATAADEAAGFPTKPVHIVVPVAAGGSADKLTRLIAQGLTERWGQPVVVENLAGASGTIGAARVAKSPADGYTLLQQGEGLTLNSILFERLPYDSQKAFAPVIKAVVNPQILVVNPQTGITDFRTYLARAKAKPQSISLGLPGNGGIAHVAHEMISQDTGALVNYIPYSGGGPATLDVLAGHVDATLITLAAVTDHVRAGKLRALAVTTPYRSAALPDVPTMAEAGLPGFSVESWQGYFAPAGTPAAVVTKINRDINAVIAAPETRAKLEDMGFKLAGGTPADMGRTLAGERVRYAKTIQTAGITLR
ncbi:MULTISPECIES: tripartite tricarboxylate transporter substrate binding protein [Variovorax]|jgi:tripartite-type tricarboxylate transporter receptor subunit TctC|uniref:tripartite tricarboxylate transporter substrate binding protein n=1 Tax=Variovorax TaxID=34072 RepID=UPI00086AB7CF|nr:MULTISPECIES: tripartite tricarboxylate transporter substrate binding protein [Variovorax]MBN8758778.1 tripartite tricarboxylate transporter substrate binding protein [Variovorax sp.]ODU19230.1 MAG: ABC transporter substrate-binding protein [Variovorax sp. SCN 67-85]ODV15472.1 MAG: ABC transporter substrate-binding protein [Variovorax sp. SCN 67-20]OJZ16127.1 MAG: ABC transporter substrate-binding protein [Variovorax sp. 67-131]UKI07555.1 tripartite tricarboxylate transporter substrate bind